MLRRCSQLWRRRPFILSGGANFAKVRRQGLKIAIPFEHFIETKYSVYNKLHNWIYIFHEWIEVLGLSQAHYSVQVVIHTDEVLIILFLSKVYLSIYES